MESFVDEGFMLPKSLGIGQPRQLVNPKVLVANTTMDTDKIKIYGCKVKTNSLLSVAEIEASEKLKIKEKCQQILSRGINCFINRQLIYDYPQQIFSHNGIISVEHADFEGTEKLADFLGSEIVSTFDDLQNAKIGHCRLITEIIIGNEKLIHF